MKLSWTTTSPSGSLLAPCSRKWGMQTVTHTTGMYQTCFKCILGWFKILMFWSWDLCTSHLICTTLMIISSYSEDFCHLQPLRASHRKFSGTVGDIENRTSPNPPFMGIQTSVCGHWSQRCMISGVLTWFWALKRPKTMKNDFYLENSHFLQFFSIFRY